MNDPYKPIKKPSGCWKWSGCMLTIVSALLIAFFVWMIVDSEREMDKSRQEFTASQIEYEEALKAYEADSLHLEKPEFHPRGHIVHLVFADTFWYRLVDTALLLAEVSQMAK